MLDGWIANQKSLSLTIHVILCTNDAHQEYSEALITTFCIDKHLLLIAIHYLANA